MSSEKNDEDAKTQIALSRSGPYIITYGVVQFLKGKDRLRAVVAVFGLLSLAAYFLSFFKLLPISLASQFASIGFLVIGGFFLWVAVISGSAFRVHIREARATEERLEAEEKFDASPDPHSALELDTKRLNEYYIINQSQARSSFRWAVLAMLLGLGTIIAGIWFFYLRQGLQDTFMTSLSTAAGLVVNAISGLFLYMYNRTRQQSLYYYDRLVKLQHTSIAIRLAETHGNEKAREEARDRVIDHLLQTSELPNRKGPDLDEA